MKRKKETKKMTKKTGKQAQRKPKKESKREQARAHSPIDTLTELIDRGNDDSTANIQESAATKSHPKK